MLSLWPVPDVSPMPLPNLWPPWGVGSARWLLWVQRGRWLLRRAALLSKVLRPWAFLGFNVWVAPEVLGFFLVWCSEVTPAGFGHSVGVCEVGGLHPCLALASADVFSDSPWGCSGRAATMTRGSQCLEVKLEEGGVWVPPADWWALKAGRPDECSWAPVDLL